MVLYDSKSDLPLVSLITFTSKGYLLLSWPALLSDWAARALLIAIQFHAPSVLAMIDPLNITPLVIYVCLLACTFFF